MNILRAIFRRRNAGGVVRPGSFVVEGEMHWSEELRPTVRGVPSEDELDGVPHDPWRPARTLGPLPKQ